MSGQASAEDLNRVACYPGTSQKYDVLLGDGLLGRLAQEIKNVVPSAGPIVVISDENVWKHWGAVVSRSFAVAEMPPPLVRVVPSGEPTKCREMKQEIEDYMLQNMCHRSSCVVGLGGGVVGDLAGFVAATYMRGIKFIQVPTTLLAVVDSSIGGKTGIDTPGGKNLVGAFHQPKLVIADIRALSTLPVRELRNGMAEVIKAGAIANEDLFIACEDSADAFDAAVAALEEARSSHGSTSTSQDRGSRGVDAGASGPSSGAGAAPVAGEDRSVLVRAATDSLVEVLLPLLTASVQVKCEVVTADEREGGLRAILNFGHTIGHGIEAQLAPRWLHGECVAVGMVKEAEAARQMGCCDSSVVGRLQRVCKAYGLPVRVPDEIDCEKCMRSMGKDKKNSVQEGSSGSGHGKPSRGEEVPEEVLELTASPLNKVSIKCVLLKEIGKVVTPPHAHAVEHQLLRRLVSQSVAVGAGEILQTAYPSAKTRGAVDAASGDGSSGSAAAPKPQGTEPAPIRIRVPGSKSISNRVLLMAGLASGTTRITGLLQSDDTQAMMGALTAVGAKMRWELGEGGGPVLVVTGTAGALSAPSKPLLFIKNAGTASRFLTTALCLLPALEGDGVVLDGNSRMRKRPAGPLVDALHRQGCELAYEPIEGEKGPPSERRALPLRFRGGGLPGGRIELAAKVSSQYVSSILLSAPYAKEPVELVLDEEKPTSLPYIEMTTAMMKQFGVEVEQLAPNHYRIPSGCYSFAGGDGSKVFEVEADASSATYPAAFAAVTGSAVLLQGIGSRSVQGDAEFSMLLKRMGCKVHRTHSTTTVIGPPPRPLVLDTAAGASADDGLIGLGSVDMSTQTDAFLTMAAVAAHSAGETHIFNIENQRVKECNRIQAMHDELAKCGARTETRQDGILIAGAVAGEGLQGARIHCYDDHRVAMAMAVFGAGLLARRRAASGLLSAAPVCPIVLDDPLCVEKTYPEFWDHLETILGVDVSAADAGALSPGSVAEVLHARLAGTQGSRTGGSTQPAAPGLADLAPRNLLQAKPRQLINASLARPFMSAVVIGMRGAGKSTLARAAAAGLGRPWRHIDLDEVLVNEEGRTVQEIVAEVGWPGFRAKEVDVLLDCLSSDDLSQHCVISCGGGIVESPVARALLRAYAQGGAASVRKLGIESGLVRKSADGSAASIIASMDPRDVLAPELEQLGPRAAGSGQAHAIVCVTRAIADIEADLGLATDRQAAVRAAQAGGLVQSGGSGAADEQRPGYSGGEGLRDVYRRRQPLFFETSSHSFVIRAGDSDWGAISSDFVAAVSGAQGLDLARGQQGSGLTLGAEVHETLLLDSAGAGGRDADENLLAMHAIDRRHRCVWDAHFAAKQAGTFFVSLTLPDVHYCAPRSSAHGVSQQQQDQPKQVVVGVPSELDESGAAVASEPDVARGLRGISAGADSIELRVDLLDACARACDMEAHLKTQRSARDAAYGALVSVSYALGCQVAAIRRHAGLPIVWTVRTAAEGGKFTGSHDLAGMLMLLGLRLGCELVDVEHGLPAFVRRCVGLAARSRAVLLQTQSLSRAIGPTPAASNVPPPLPKSIAVSELLPLMAWSSPTIIWSKHFPEAPQPAQSYLQECFAAMRQESIALDPLAKAGLRVGCKDVIKIVTRAQAPADVHAVRSASLADARAEARDCRDQVAKLGAASQGSTGPAGASHRGAVDVERAFRLPGLWAVPVSASTRIVLAMGDEGKLSRVLNECMTPCTSPLLPGAAAPGQLSVAQVQRLRASQGLVRPLKLALFGHPIGKSPSPIMHNTSFAAMALPHEYLLSSTEDQSMVRASLEGRMNGGGSVTMPLKITTMPWMAGLAPAARAIGALNTIVRTDSADADLRHSGIVNVLEPKRQGEASGTSAVPFFGYNTDWLGIAIPVSAALRCRDQALVQSSAAAGSAAAPIAGDSRGCIVLGAGGTARAALFAARQLGLTLFVWNRTAAKAEALATEVGATAVPTLAESATLMKSAGCSLDLILCTVPPAAQLTVPEALLQSKPVVLDAAYLPRTTALTAQAEAAGCPTVRGIQMLIAQGIAQSALWTGKQPPSGKIMQSVLRYYDAVSRTLPGGQGAIGAAAVSSAAAEVQRIDTEIQRMVQVRTELLQRAAEASVIDTTGAADGGQQSGGTRAGQLLAAQRDALPGPVPSSAMRVVLESVDAACAVGRPHASSRTKKIAFCGSVGSFAHAAAIRLNASSGMGARLIPCLTVQDVFAQVQTGKVDGGVALIESSREGVDHQALRCLVSASNSDGVVQVLGAKQATAAAGESAAAKGESTLSATGADFTIDVAIVRETFVALDEALCKPRGMGGLRSATRVIGTGPALRRFVPYLRVACSRECSFQVVEKSVQAAETASRLAQQGEQALALAPPAAAAQFGLEIVARGAEMDREGPRAELLTGSGGAGGSAGSGSSSIPAIEDVASALPSTHLSPRSSVGRYVLLTKTSIAEQLLVSSTAGSAGASSGSAPAADGMPSAADGVVVPAPRRASLVISLADRKGALGDVLSTMAQHGINLTKLESFPAGDARAYLSAASPGTGAESAGLHRPVFRFFVEAHVDESPEPLMRAARELRSGGARVRIVGIYDCGAPATT